MSSPQWCFADFRLDLANACLWRGTQPLALTPKAFNVLHYLVTHPDRLVTKDTLLDAVWPETAISEAVVRIAIGELRRALGDTAQAPRFIATVHRRGYRFVAPVAAHTEEASGPAAPVMSAAPQTLAAGPSEAPTPPPDRSAASPRLGVQPLPAALVPPEAERRRPRPDAAGRPRAGSGATGGALGTGQRRHGPGGGTGGRGWHWEIAPGGGFRTHLTPLTLTPLTRSHVEAMVQGLLRGHHLPAAVLAQIVAQTDGIPLFVEEVTKAVVEAGLSTTGPAQDATIGPLPALAIPATLHEALMARLDRLGSAKSVAQLGATIGREFAYTLLRAVAPLEDEALQRGLATLVAAELLYQRGQPPRAIYRFKHALIQEVAYESVLRSVRRQTHQRILQVLEAQFPETAATAPARGADCRSCRSSL